jgi:hypothetical protein
MSYTYTYTYVIYIYIYIYMKYLYPYQSCTKIKVVYVPLPSKGWGRCGRRMWRAPWRAPPGAPAAPPPPPPSPAARQGPTPPPLHEHGNHAQPAMMCLAWVADRAAAGPKEPRQGRAEIQEGEEAVGNSTFAFDGLSLGVHGAVHRPGFSLWPFFWRVKMEFLALVR